MALWVEKATLPSDGLPIYSGNYWGLDGSSQPPGAFVNSTFYLTGGQSIGASGTNEFETYSYTPSNNTWTAIRDDSNNLVLVPHIRTNTTGASVDGLFCTLAKDPAASGTSQPTYLDYYTPSTKTWTTITPPSSASTVRFNVEYNSCVGYGTRLYSFGGIAGGSGGSFQRRGYWYDFSNDTWGLTSEWTSVTSSRAYQQGGCVYGSKIYLFGGAIGSIFGGNFNTVLVYDPVADTWASGGTLPNAMRFAIAGAIGSRIWVTGKQGGTGKTLEYDPDTQAFTDHTEADHLTNGWGGAGGSDGSNLYHACPGGDWQNQYSHTDYSSHFSDNLEGAAMLQLLPAHRFTKDIALAGSGSLIANAEIAATANFGPYVGAIVIV